MKNNLIDRAIDAHLESKNELKRYNELFEKYICLIENSRKILKNSENILNKNEFHSNFYDEEKYQPNLNPYYLKTNDLIQRHSRSIEKAKKIRKYAEEIRKINENLQLDAKKNEPIVITRVKQGTLEIKILSKLF